MKSTVTIRQFTGNRGSTGMTILDEAVVDYLPGRHAWTNDQVAAFHAGLYRLAQRTICR